MMNLIIVVSSLIGVFGVYEITKGAKLHELNYLHEKYNHLFMKEVHNFQVTPTNNVDLIAKRLEVLRKPPTECLEVIGWLERQFLQWIGTERAVTLCQDDLLTADKTRDFILDYELGKISKDSLIAALNRSGEEFQRHSQEFSHLVEGSVRTYFILILYLVIIKGFFVVFGCFFILKSLSKDYKSLQSKELENKQRKKDFEMIFNMAPVGICYKDDKNNILSINKKGAELLGLSVDEILSKSVFDLMPDMAQRYYLDDLIVIESGQPKLDVFEEFINPHGDLRWFRTNKVPYTDPDTGVEGVLLVSQDFTDLKVAEERLSLAWEGSGDGYWDWDITTGEVIYSSKFKELLGYEDYEYTNRFEAWTDALHPDEKAQVLSAIDRHLKHNVEYDIDFRMLTKSGEWRWFRARGQALRRDNNLAYRMSGSIQDITEFKAEDEMKSALIEKLKKANTKPAPSSDVG